MSAFEGVASLKTVTQTHMDRFRSMLLCSDDSTSLATDVNVNLADVKMTRFSKAFSYEKQGATTSNKTTLKDLSCVALRQVSINKPSNIPNN